MITCENSLCLYPAEVNMRAPDGSRRWLCRLHTQVMEVLRAGWSDPVTIARKPEPAPKTINEERAELVRLRARVAEELEAKVAAPPWETLNVLDGEIDRLQAEVDRCHALYPSLQNK